MTNAKADDVIRITADVTSLFHERTIPAGTEGLVLEVMSGGTYLADVTLRPATDERDGDFDQVALREDQFEVISRRGSV